jgi:hypothetical protein
LYCDTVAVLIIRFTSIKRSSYIEKTGEKIRGFKPRVLIHKNQKIKWFFIEIKGESGCCEKHGRMIECD